MNLPKEEFKLPKQAAKAYQLGYPESEKRNRDTDIQQINIGGNLRGLPFWCKNETLHIEKPDTYHKEYCCTTHVVGLPEHPATEEAMPLTPYQVEFVNAVMHTVSNYGRMAEVDWKKLSHMFHVLKGRQMGFTEIVLRVIQHFCFNRYAGKNVGIIAATNGNLARKDLRRFNRLFKNIPHTIKTPLRGSKIELMNGTIIEAFPASEEALTGDTKYGAIFMDESAKWKLVDDTPVFNSVMPIVRSNGADLFLVSTPKGPLKMFYKIYKNPQDFIMLRYDIWRAEDNLYTKERIENMLASSKEDPNQEYLCEFTIGQDSIFGDVSGEHTKAELQEWDVLDDDEDDSYVEKEE